MNDKEFVASLAGSLAWPLVALVAILVFRHELRALMRRPMKRFAVGPIEAEWDPIADQTREAIDEIGQEDLRLNEAVGERDDPDIPDDGFTGHLRPIADVEPAVAIQAAHALVGNELIRRLVEAGQPQLPTAKFSVGHLAVVARNVKLISPATLKAIHGLDVLRNLAAHSESKRVTRTEAHEFLDLVEGVLFAMATQSPEGN